ncbi:hypothetical protein C8F01DRAFT_1262865 [Mycena amicta]|nr:hypothetical protein C8F01DRAFT_1262865 [Mycena amicta]
MLRSPLLLVAALGGRSLDGAGGTDAHSFEAASFHRCVASSVMARYCQNIHFAELRRRLLVPFRLPRAEDGNDLNRRTAQSTPNPTLRTHLIRTRLFDQLFDLAAPFYLHLPLLEDLPYTSSRPWWILGKHTTSFPTILDHAIRSSFPVGLHWPIVPVGIVAIPG